MDIENGYNGAVSSIISKSCEGEIKQRIHEQFPELTRIEVEGKYEFYICDLIPKSLLVDSKSTGNTWKDLGKRGLTVLYITDFGKEFLRFINSEF